MNAVSEKNQKFIFEGLNLLSSVDDLKQCEEEIFSYLKAYSNGSIIDKTELFKVIDKAEYFKVKTDDIIGTISLHVSKVQYEQDDVKDKLTAVNKNACIGKVTLPANIVTSSVLPDFDITIVNLGLDGIDKDRDEIYLKLYYPDLTEFSEKIVPINNNVSNLMDTVKVSVTNMKSPGRNYQYNLSIKVRQRDTGLVFGNMEIRGINISKEVDSFHVIQETYQRVQD